jgi:hypothetical protein
MPVDLALEERHGARQPRRPEPFRQLPPVGMQASHDASEQVLGERAPGARLQRGFPHRAARQPHEGVPRLPRVRSQHRYGTTRGGVLFPHPGLAAIRRTRYYP